MNCSQAREYFAGHIDGLLELSIKEKLEAHLKECPACSRHVEELRRTIELLDEAYAGAAVDSREIASQVAEHAAAAKARRTKMERGSKLIKFWNVAAMLMVVAGVVGVLSIIKWPRPELSRDSAPVQQRPLAQPPAKQKLEEKGIARVDVRRGAVGIRPSLRARWALAQKDSAVAPNDFIRVGEDPFACARVGTPDNVVVSMNTSSAVQFITKNHVLVLAGEAHFSVPTGAPLIVDTPLGSIAVKGTAFEVNVEPGRTTVAVSQGAVELSAHGQKYEVRAGSSCVVTQAGVTKAGPDLAEWLAKFEQMPADETLGRLMVTIDGNDVPLSVKSHTVKVTIRDQIAYTLVDEVFANHTGRRMEGTFYYPLPAGASISRFAMYIGDTLMEGEIVERMRAREVYESIVRRKRDPALLEWMGGNQFKARVFPIEPHSTKRVFIGYTQILPRDGDVVRYSYPLKSEKLTKNPLSSLHIEVDASSTPAITGFNSPTHACRIEADEHSGRAVFSATDYTPTRNFVVSYIVTGLESELYTVPHWRDDEGGYFLAFVSPRSLPIAFDSDAEGPTTNVLLMIDTSASMAGDNFETAKRIATTYLNFLGEKDRFNVLLYDVEPQLMFPEFVDNLVEFRRLAAEKLNKIDPLGAGDLGKAISAAADAIAQAEVDDDGGEARILYIGDGVATLGETEPVRLLEQAEVAFGLAGDKVTVSTFAVGSEYDQAFIEGFARQFDGVAKLVSSARPVEDIVAEMVSDSFTPMITDLTLAFDGVDVLDVYPRSLPNLRVGGQVIVAGRYKEAGEGALTVTGFGGGHTYRRAIEISLPAEKGPNTFVPRLWARRAMDDMLHRIGRGEQELAGEVIDLSLKYKLMSPYTSFLVLETEEDYKRFGIDRRFSMEQWAGGPAKPREGMPQMEQAAGSEINVLDMISVRKDLKGWGGPRNGYDSAFPMNGESRYFEGGNRKGRLDEFGIPESKAWWGKTPVSKRRELVAYDSASSMRPMASRAPFAQLAESNAYYRNGRLVYSSQRESKRALAKSAPGFGGSRSRRGDRRYNRGGTLYQPMYIRQVRPKPEKPEPPEVDPEVRKVVECFAKGPADFHLRRTTTSYDKDGKVRSVREQIVTVIGKKFSRMYRADGKVTSRDLSDGELYYRCDDTKNYARARKINWSDTNRLSSALPGMTGYTVDEFLIERGPLKIESREGDIVVLADEKESSKRRVFVDTARKVVTKAEWYRREKPEDEFKLSSHTVYDEIRTVGERAIPTRSLHYDKEGKLTSKEIYDTVQLGELEGDFEFAPPPDMLVAVYPLPSVDKARKAAEATKTANANFVLALSLENAGMFKEAARAAEKVIAAKPDDVYLLLYRGWLKTVAGEPGALTKATKEAEKIIRDNNADKETLNQELFALYQSLYNIMGSAGLHNERQEYLEKLFELSPKDSGQRINWANQLARSYANRGEPYKGRELWLKLLEEAPTNGYAWHQAAQFLRNRSEFADEAEEAYLKARELGNDIGSQLAQYYQNRGELDKAIVEWRERFKKNISRYEFRNFLQSIAQERGPEAATKEAEKIIAGQEDAGRRKQAMLGYFQFARDDQWAVALGAVSKKLHEAYPEDTEVLQQLLQAHRDYRSSYNPMAAITKLLAAKPKDRREAINWLQLLQNLASYGYREEAARLVEAFEEPEFEMTPQEMADYLANLAYARRNIDPQQAMNTWRRVLELDLPDTDSRKSQAMFNIFRALLDAGDIDAARKAFLETVEKYPQHPNAQSMFQNVANALQQSEKYAELIVLHTQLQELRPAQEYFHRLQIAAAKAAQEKTQEAYDLLWAIVQDTDASVQRKKAAEAADAEPSEAAKEPDVEKEEAYYFYRAGRALIDITAEDDELKAKFDKDVTARASDEDLAGDVRWSELFLDLLRARGKFKEMVSLLEKIAGAREEDDRMQWQLAATYAATRRYAEAVAIYEKLAVKYPDDPAVLMELSKLAGAMKQPARAQEYWQKWLEALPDDEGYLQQIARRFADSGDSHRAIAVYEKLLGFARYPDNHLRNLAREYEKLDRKLDAAMAYVKATRPASGRQRRNYDRFNKIWPLITEEGRFNKFTAALEEEIRESDEASRRARLAALMADVHAKRGDKATAGTWAEKAIGGVADVDQKAFESALNTLKAARSGEDVLALLRKAIDDAGEKAPEWARFLFARELLVLGRRDEGEKMFRELIDATRPFARHEKMLELAELIFHHAPANEVNAWMQGEGVPAGRFHRPRVLEAEEPPPAGVWNAAGGVLVYDPRALELVDEVIKNGRGRLAARALRTKADLMAKSNQYPVAEVVEVYRAAAAAGPVEERKRAAESMRDFASKAKEHDAVFEALGLLCRNARGNTRNSMAHARRYMEQHNLQDRAEEVLRKLVGYARPGYDSRQAWREFGEEFRRRGDSQKAVEIWAEGITKAKQGSGSRGRHYDLLSRICSAILRERNKEKIDREFVGKLLLEEVDRRLGEARLADRGWPSNYVGAVKELNLLDKVLAKLDAVPEGRKELGHIYAMIGETYERQLSNPEMALKYYEMALESSGLRRRNQVLQRTVEVHKKQGEWQKALDRVNEWIKSDQGYNRKAQQGYFLAKLGRTEEALKAYEEASGLAGDRAQNYYNRREVGKSAFEAGLYDFAIEKLTLSLRMHDYSRRGNRADDSHMRDCYSYLAKCYRGKGEMKKAVDTLLTAVTRVREGRRRQLYDELKTTLRESGELDQLIAEYEREAEETRTEKPVLRMIFGDIFRDQGKNDDAIRHYKAALEVAPSNADIRKRVIELLAREAKRDPNRQDELIAQHRDWARYDPKNTEHYRRMGELLKRTGREAQAMRAYTTMIEAMPTEAASHRDMARIYSNMGRPDDATTMWKRVVKFRPEEPDGYRGLAQSYIRSRQPDLAEEVYNRMLERTWEQRFGDVRSDIERRLRKLQER